MAEQKILISININDKQAKKGADGVAKSLSKVERAQAELNFELSAAGKEYAKLKAATNDQRLANNLAAKSAVNMAKGIKQGRAQSGLNNAILLETGRLASDASFGFTAIANNLSQVVTLFSSFAKTNGGVIASIKELGKSLLGTGGLLIGIQLLISFGPKLVKLLENTSAKAVDLKRAFKDAGNEVQETAGRFQTYIARLQDANTSQKEQEKVVKLLNKKFPDYIKQINEAGVSIENIKDSTDDATKQNLLYEESIRRIARSKAAQKAIEEEAAAEIQSTLNVERILRKTYNMTLEEATEATKVYNEELKNGETIMAGGLGSTTMTNSAINRQSENIKVLVNNLKVETDQRKKNIQILEDYIILGDEETKKRKDRNRIFKEADLDFEKEILSSQQRIEKLEARHEKDLIAIKINAMGEKAALKQSEFEQDQSRRLRDFLQSEATLTQKQLAEERYNNSIAKSKESLYKYLIQLDGEYNATISDLEERRELEDLSAFGKALQIFNTERLKFQEQFLKSYTDSEIDRVEVAKQLENDRFNNEMLNLKAIREQRIADGETIFEIDQKIANATVANSEASIALAQAERDAKIGIANQVGEAIVAVAGEGSTVGKAASVAMAIMNTREAFTAALGAKPYSAFNIAQAAAVLAMGFKQVKEIMAVKIPGKDPASSGVGTVIEAPDFNVVGASQTSQLAQTVAGEQAKPVRAFVVGKDISTQQEMDRNITNTASFG